MKILLVASEVVPFAKTGGLADVAGSLPKALQHFGHDIRIIMPRYKMIDPAKYELKKVADDIYEGKVPGTDIIVYFYENENYFGSRDDLYQVKGVDFPDNLERFAGFCQAVPRFIKGYHWQPDIIHLNDWQTALIAAYLRVNYHDDPFFRRIAVIYSIHNMGYHGSFPKEKLPLTGLGWDQFVPEKLEFWGQIALCKAGLVYADKINTVSKTYAKEIQTEEYGAGLDGLLRFRSNDVSGIVNGLDYEVWNPATDQQIIKRYSAATISLKSDNKLELQKQHQLPQQVDIPVVGMITRLADQKGFDILATVLDKIMKEKCQLIILGTGEPKYHQLLEQAKQKYPGHIGVNLTFNAFIAELIYAGADLFLMPSKYEPCGLGQLISFKYGTIPVVRQTGGLADTVHEFDQKSGGGEGFVFADYTGDALYAAVKRGIEAFKNKVAWKKLEQKVMNLDYSWDASAKEYINLYKLAIATRA
jgi:starch synthase